MITRITYIFGFSMKKSIITAVVSSVAGTQTATVAGKTIVANLLKHIPGGGTIAGGAISAATAGALTATLGNAYIKVLEEMFKGGQTEALNNEDKMTRLLQQKLYEYSRNR
jgi:uncharacterized protein (DUF697 family)